MLGAARGARRRAAARPHDDPQPARRIARRILQRLNGMGKWGGYHTDFRHLARGFAGNERALADEVGEALLEAGLLEREAERRPAPRLPQPAPRGRHPRPDRARRGAARPAPAVSVRHVGPMLPRHAVDEGLHRAHARSASRDVRARRAPTRLARVRQGAAGAGGRRSAAGYAVVGDPLPRRDRDHRRARLADVRRACTGARTRSRTRWRDDGHRRGRQRRDPVPQPPRLRRGDGRVRRSSAPTRCFSTRPSRRRSSAEVCAREGPRAIVYDEEFARRRRRRRARAPALRRVDRLRPPRRRRRRRSRQLIERGRPRPTLRAAASHGPPVVILTSGTTGAPKGAQPQRSPRRSTRPPALLSMIPLRARERTLIARRCFTPGAWRTSCSASGCRSTLVLRRRFDAARTRCGRSTSTA